MGVGASYNKAIRCYGNVLESNVKEVQVKERNNKQQESKKGALISGFYIFTPRR